MSKQSKQTENDNTLDKLYAEFKKQKDELRKLRKTKDKLFSIIGHDLKSPLNSLVSYSDFLMSNFNNLSPEESHECIKRVNETAKQANELLKKLVSWSRAQSDELEFNPAKCNLKNLVNVNVMLYSQVAALKNIKICEDIDEACHVNIDIHMINTVLRSLLNIAIKLTENNGFITIINEDNNENVEVIIKDTGLERCIDDKDKQLVIDNNFMEKDRINDTGSDLGLIISKEFIERNGGRLTISKKEGEGLVVQVTLPKYND